MSRIQAHAASRRSISPARGELAVSVKRWLLVAASFAATLSVSAWILWTGWAVGGAPPVIPLAAHGLAFVAVLAEILTRAVKIKWSAAALRILRAWAVAAAGDPPDAPGMSFAARTFLRSYHRLLSTTLHRWHACRVHQAAEWFLDNAGGSDAGPTWDDAARPPARTCAPAPCYHRRGLALADIDPVGLALAASSDDPLT